MTEVAKSEKKTKQERAPAPGKKMYGLVIKNNASKHQSDLKNTKRRMLIKSSRTYLQH